MVRNTYVNTHIGMLHVFTPCNIYGVESVSYLKYKTIKSKAVLETVVKDISFYGSPAKFRV